MLGGFKVEVPRTVEIGRVWLEPQTRISYLSCIEFETTHQTALTTVQGNARDAGIFQASCRLSLFKRLV